MDEGKNKNPLDREEKTTDIITLRQLLSGLHVFRVPDYQRGYAWGDEFAVMWQDILRLRGTGSRRHYTGMLALEEITDDYIKRQERSLGTEPYYIVDGQQRITSLVIIVSSLLSYIREELPEKDMHCYDGLLAVNGVYRFGYSVQRMDDAAIFFEEKIYINDTNRSPADKYLSNIDAAKTFIDSELNRISAAEASEILEIVLERLVFNIYFVTQDFDVRVTFETMNNRGRHLSKLELLKNRLMYLSSFFPKDDNHGDLLRGRINEAWQSIYENLGRAGGQLSDDEYLKAHWIVYGHLNKRKSDAYIDDLLGEKFAADKGEFAKLISKAQYEKAYEYICEYIISLSKYSFYWAFVNSPGDVPIKAEKDEEEWIERLSRLGGDLFLRAALMAVSAESSDFHADKVSFYQKLELYVFTHRFIAQEKRLDLSFLVTRAGRFLKKNEDKKAAFRDLLAAFDSHGQGNNALKVRDAFRAFGINVMDRKTNYYYDWNGLPYFLYEYNESLGIPNAAQIKWCELRGTSIEHILPQTPTTEYWKTAFEGFDDEVRRIITNSLGNLLLLSCGSENSSLRNYSFPVKKDMTVESRRFAYRFGSRSAQKIAEKDHWTINEIVERADRLIRFMHDRWFSSLSDEEWTECAETLKRGLPAPINDKEHEALKKKLDTINISGERSQAAASVACTKTDEYHRKFLDYISDSIEIRFTQKLSFKEWFTVKMDGEAPGSLICGVKADEKRYRIEYQYGSNQITVWNIDSGEYIDKADPLPEKLRTFMLSLSRYIRRGLGKDEPEWYTGS